MKEEPCEECGKMVTGFNLGTQLTFNSGKRVTLCNDDFEPFVVNMISGLAPYLVEEMKRRIKSNKGRFG